CPSAPLPPARSAPHTTSAGSAVVPTPPSQVVAPRLRCGIRNGTPTPSPFTRKGASHDASAPPHGGGLSPEATRRIGARPDFFLPVRVLSRVFRGQFLAGLRAAYAGGQLRITGRCPEGETAAFEHLVSTAVATDWVVSA